MNSDKADESFAADGTMSTKHFDLSVFIRRYPSLSVFQRFSFP
jgi:hypothetical protein